MLAKARERVQRDKLTNVNGLLEMDAEDTKFEDASFDIAVAMFVASVVPHPRQLLRELKRVVRPGGYILFVNHFLAPGGVRGAVEHALGRASHSLGWHPDFAMQSLLPDEDIRRAYIQPVPPLGCLLWSHWKICLYNLCAPAKAGAFLLRGRKWHLRVCNINMMEQFYAVPRAKGVELHDASKKLEIGA